MTPTIALDVHKDGISIAACDGSRGPTRFVGTVSSDVRQVIEALAKAGEPGEVCVVYEAGPTGYGLYRELRRRGRPRGTSQGTFRGTRGTSGGTYL